jgi:hypothetical protein
VDQGYRGGNFGYGNLKIEEEPIINDPGSLEFHLKSSFGDDSIEQLQLLATDFMVEKSFFNSREVASCPYVPHLVGCSSPSP